MSRPNPFERQARPASITEADQSVKVIQGPPVETFERQNPFLPKEQNRNEHHEQHENGTNGAPLKPAATTGSGSLQHFVQLPTFGDAPRPLNSRDVCSFIVNKMVGTGIYTTPPVVLLLTRSKGEALGLWFVGFLYTLVRYALAEVCYSCCLPPLIRFI